MVPMVVPSLLRLHFILLKGGKTALISELCVGPVQMVGGDKGQEVAECL